jgi:hypothetical protein
MEIKWTWQSHHHHYTQSWRTLLYCCCWWWWCFPDFISHELLIKIIILLIFCMPDKIFSHWEDYVIHSLMCQHVSIIHFKCIFLCHLVIHLWSYHILTGVIWCDGQCLMQPSLPSSFGHWHHSLETWSVEKWCWDQHAPISWNQFFWLL